MRYCLPALSLGALLWIALPSSPSSADPGNEDKPAKQGTSAQAEKKEKDKKEKKEKKAKKDEKGEAQKVAEKDEAKKSDAKKADEKKAKPEKADEKKAKAEPAKAGTKEDKKVKAKTGKEKTAEGDEQEAEEEKPDPKKADQKKPDLKKDPKKADQKKDEGQRFPRAPDLSEAPRRTAVGFEKVSKEKRAKAEKIVTTVLKKLKGVAAWNLDSSSKAQVQAAVKRIKAEGKKLDEAGDLFTESFNTEKLSLKLYIRAAQVRELTTGNKTDVTKLNNRLADLTWGKPQAPIEARVKSVKLLVDALAEYIQGHLAEAIVLTSKSVQADKNQALSYAYQGSFYYLTQNKQLAIQAWTKALRLDPSNEEVRQALKSLGSSEK